MTPPRSTGLQMHADAADAAARTPRRRWTVAMPAGGRDFVEDRRE